MSNEATDRPAESDPSLSAEPSASEVEEAAAAPIEEDLDELTILVRERDEFRETAQRLQADFENYRKRVARQSEELAARGATDLVTTLLPVLDALDLAEAHLNLSEGEEQSVEAQALAQASSLLRDTLSKQGLETVPGAGEPFDPTVHDAVAHAAEEGDEQGPIVDEVLRAGYTWRGAVLRPAMVRVRG